MKTGGFAEIAEELLKGTLRPQQSSSSADQEWRNGLLTLKHKDGLYVHGFLSYINHNIPTSPKSDNSLLKGLNKEI